MKPARPHALQVGERLGRFEVEKRCAVEKEDYDLAKEKKLHMEHFRSQVYEQLQLHSLVDAQPVGARAAPRAPRNVHTAPPRRRRFRPMVSALGPRRRCRWTCARRQTRQGGEGTGPGSSVSSPARLPPL